MADDDAPGNVPDLVPPGWEQAVTVAPMLALLRYPDGAVRVRHRCDRSARSAHLLGSDGFDGEIDCAPALSPGHVVTWPALGTDGCDKPTVSPSILCPDCGLHGFVIHGEWMPA